MAKLSKKLFPLGSTFEPWRIAVRDSGINVVVRNVKLPNGKRTTDRLELGFYKAVRNEKKKLQAKVDRLNGRDREAQEAQALQAIRAAFIEPALIEGFTKKLQLEVPSKKVLKQNLSALNRYVLQFFVLKLQLPDPKKWNHVDAQTKWGAALLNRPDVVDELKLYDNPKFLPSRRLLRHIVQMANRFTKYLHETHRDEYPLMVFTPVSKPVLKQQEGQRKLKPKSKSKHALLRKEALKAVDEDVGLFISDADWTKIEAVLPITIKPFVVLAYMLGFRMAESLAVDTDQIYEEYYLAQYQLETFSPFRDWKSGIKTLKDYESRKIPYWFCTPDEVYSLVSSIKKRMHPNTLGKAFAKLMLDLEMPYEMHDLRRTFITRALRGQSPIDVQNAAGHSDLKTTMRYRMEDRKLSNKKFVPKVKVAV